MFLSRVAVFLLAVASIMTGGDTPSLRSIKKIYIEKMDNNLDQYLRAKVRKLKEEDADGILTGVNDEQKRTATKITGRYFGLHDTVNGTLSLLPQNGERNPVAR